jgi:transposase InsO family protein
MVHSFKNVTEGTMPDEKLTLDEKYKYLKLQYARYRKANRPTKGVMLAEMAAVTDLHVKSVTRLMRSSPSRHPRTTGRRRTYGPEVDDLIRAVDRALDQPCRERLQPMLGYVVDHLAALGLVRVSPDVRHQLDTISVSTVGRILARIRQDAPRLRTRSGKTSVTPIQAQVPIRKIPWDESVPGHFEVDLVFHSGPSASGDFVYTLQMVDVATGWSECAAILGRSFRAIKDGFLRCLKRIPFPVLEVHTDNGAEFLNAHLLRFWKEKYTGVFLSRGRPYHSQDNRFVEQRNGGLIRALLGNERLDTAQQTLQLNRLYELLWRYFNFFQPVMRQTSKTHEDGRTRRKHDDVRTPFQRVLASECASNDWAQAQQAIFANTNPLRLKQELEAAVMTLFKLPGAVSGQTEDVFETLSPLPSAERRGQPGNILS